jgi:hypothetical protein
VKFHAHLTTDNTLTLMTLITQLATDPATLEAMKEATDFLSTKDLKWWFAGLFVLFVVTSIFIVRLLLKYHQSHLESMSSQLTDQRTANQALNERLLAYITTDHQQSVETQRRVGEALNRLSDAILRWSAPAGGRSPLFDSTIPTQTHDQY